MRCVTCIVTWVGVMTHDPHEFQLTCPQGIAFMKCISSTLELEIILVGWCCPTPPRSLTAGTWEHIPFLEKEKDLETINLLGVPMWVFGVCDVFVNCHHFYRMIPSHHGWHLYICGDGIKVVGFSQLLISLSFCCHQTLSQICLGIRIL